MFLEIVTPVKKVFEGEVNIVTFPGIDGSFQVMNDHAPLVSTLKEGTVVYKDKEGAEKVTITGGVVEVLNNKIVLLADGLKD
ncbi:MAG: ATP synthase F1 subunit epsilon [Fulvivirga sp.]|nr:ATP synthase F1 subunit epsilon [Fulvivirga sp.]